MKPVRVLVALLLLLGPAIGAYWWWSPFLVLHQLQEASARGDADAVSAHIDYPVLRENLRAQFSVALSHRMEDVKNHPLAALGGAFGLAVGRQMIDVLVRPETIEAAIRSGQVTPSTVAATGPATPPEGNGNANEEKLKWATERVGANRVIARLHREGQPTGNAPAFVLVRHGFADWKLSDLRIDLEK